MVPDGHAVKAEHHHESSNVGLGLFDQSHSQTHESGNLGLFPTLTFSNASAMGGVGGGERLPMLHHPSPPHVANGTLLSSPSHYLGAGMNSMHVSQGSNGQHSSYAGEGKPVFTSMLSVLEPLDTGSPLTEATGNASPQSHAFGGCGSGSGRESMHPEAKEERSDPLIDPHLIGGNASGYSSSSSPAGSARGGQSDRRW